jgi:hypothetical protein
MNLNYDKLLAIVCLGVIACAALWLGTEGGKDIALTAVGAIGGMTISAAMPVKSFK